MIRRLATGLPLLAALAFLSPLALPFASTFPVRPASADEPAPANPVAGPDEAQRAKVKAIVDELREDAARIRGLAWKQNVPADLLSRAELKVKLEEMIKEELKPDEYERDLKILRRLGTLAPDEDPLQIMMRFLEKGIAGFYNPKTKRLYLIDGPTVDAQRPTILHELIHALEDQYIDLEKLQKAVEEDSDRLFALKCAIEGSAETAKAQYEKENPEIARIAREESAKSQNMDELVESLRTTPAFLVLPTLMHYQTGPALVQRYCGKDYRAGIERMYADDYPLSQECCLHPRKFVTEHRDLPRKITWSESVVAAAGEGFKGLKATGVGQLDFVLWIDHYLGGANGKLKIQNMSSGTFWSKKAGKAAEGWDGMTMQVVEKDGKPTMVLVASAWDSPTDASEAVQALLEVLRKQHGDGFKLGAVAGTKSDAGTTETTSFTSPFGAGRVVQRGDAVWAIDGAPADRLDAVAAALEAIPMVRDPKDTWTPGNEGDPLAGATWQDRGIGWKAPEGFTAGADGKPGSFVKGGLKLKATVIPGHAQLAVMTLVGSIRTNYPKSSFDISRLREMLVELKVGGKTAGRIEFEDPTPEGAVTHQLFFVPVSEKATLVLHAEGAKDGWTAAERDLTDALEGFVFKE